MPSSDNPYVPTDLIQQGLAALLNSQGIPAELYSGSLAASVLINQTTLQDIQSWGQQPNPCEDFLAMSSSIHKCEHICPHIKIYWPEYLEALVRWLEARPNIAWTQMERAWSQAWPECLSRPAPVIPVNRLALDVLLETRPDLMRLELAGETFVHVEPWPESELRQLATEIQSFTRNSF